MQFLTGKTMPRRTFLRGLGATVALPYLDAMVPATRFLGKASGAAVIDKPRFVAIESVHVSRPSLDDVIAYVLGPERGSLSRRCGLICTTQISSGRSGRSVSSRTGGLVANKPSQ